MKRLLMEGLIPTLGIAEAQESENILIRNVRLIDRSGQAEDQSVNILIKEAKLNIITKDEIELREEMIGYDAQNGVLMGNLDIGQPTNFMIVDRNPREDIEVLLDTKSYVVFAIRNGTIVRNTLPLITAVEPEPEKKKEPRWLASEWVRNTVKAPELDNPVFSGYHVSGSWTLTGEMRPYNKRNGTFGPVPVEKSIHHEGLGVWELSARYSSLDRFDVRGHSSGIMARVILMLE